MCKGLEENRSPGDTSLRERKEKGREAVSVARGKLRTDHSELRSKGKIRGNKNPTSRSRSLATLKGDRLVGETVEQGSDRLGSFKELFAWQRRLKLIFTRCYLIARPDSVLCP